MLKCFVPLVGWIGVAFLGIHIYRTQASLKIWDPFKILNVTPFSSMDYVKRQYKLLSRKLHPDKQWGVPKDEAEAKFIHLTTAYTAYGRLRGPLTGRLTNVEVRENYFACGNPERCTDVAILGIALPKAIKEQSALSYFCILVYGLGLAVIVPSLVGSWWAQIRTTDEWLNPITGNLFFKFCMDKKGASFQDLIRLFCHTEEIRQEVRLVADNFHISLAGGKKSMVSDTLR
jgi:translocation protein SEC63